MSDERRKPVASHQLDERRATSDERRPSDDSGSAPLWDAPHLRDPHAAADKAARVRAMFDGIAPTYQFVNSVASAGRDRAWRRALVRWADVGPDDRVLDIACGTGDLAEGFKGAGARQVIGLDFAREMLRHFHGRRSGGVACCQADAMALPLPDASCDVTSCAFGIRNFQDLRRGLSEMHRVLRPGGRAMILEFSMPRAPIVGGLYRFYFTRIMPRLAACLSRDRSGAYRYLPSSVQTFAAPEDIRSLLLDVGFAAVDMRRMTCGVVCLFRATKASGRRLQA
jgi:demethylmenaquinone methyltransferase/2-methoxy-6-polyprenyl-1,4-benzoquinol methylase